MPPRILDHDEDLQLDLRQGPQASERGKWIQRAQQSRRLPKPLNQLGARGVWVPPPPANSQGAVVKLWTAKASTTGVHTTYLRQGKGLDGADADLFDRDGPVDRQTFVHRARQDGHQIRGMVSLDAGERANLRRFVPRLMAQFEADIGSRVDWLGAIAPRHVPGACAPRHPRRAAERPETLPDEVVLGARVSLPGAGGRHGNAGAGARRAHWSRP